MLSIKDAAELPSVRAFGRAQPEPGTRMPTRAQAGACVTGAERRTTVESYRKISLSFRSCSVWRETSVLNAMATGAPALCAKRHCTVHLRKWHPGTAVKVALRTRVAKPRRETIARQSYRTWTAFTQPCECLPSRIRSCCDAIFRGEPYHVWLQW